ncbi:hypothetical protein GEMRC1_009597 [Eukaryota sp. GEM-RC1]
MRLFLVFLLYLPFLFARPLPAFKDSTESLGLSDEKYSLLAFGDFNNDLATDVFVIKYGDSPTIKVLKWLQSESGFKGIAESSFTIAKTDYTTGIPTDFNRDGRLDLLLTSRLPNSSYHSSLYVQDKDAPILTLHADDYTIPPLATQPLVISFNTSMRPSLIAQLDSGEPVFINNTGSSFDVLPLSTIIPKLDEDFSLADLPHVYTDMNGDCIADLVLFSEGQCLEEESATCIQANIFVRTEFDFEPSRVVVLPRYSGAPIISDGNRDGVPDFVIPIRYPDGHSSIRILYNSQMPLCQDLRLDIRTQKDCRPSNNLCLIDKDYQIGFDRKESNLDHTHWINIDLPTDFKFSSLLTLDNPSGDLLAAGDYNSDGFSDLLLPLKDDENLKYFTIIENVACNTNRSLAECSTPKDVHHQRSLGLASNDLSLLTSQKPAKRAGFFDFGNNGALDLLVELDGDKPSLVGLENSIDNSAFFLATLAGNGVCHQWCASPLPRLPNPKPFGVNAVGTTFKFRLLDFDSSIIVHGDTLFNQQSHNSLQLPFGYFGLGTIATYIDELFLGIPNGLYSTRKDYSISWMTLMPNTLVYVFPVPASEPSHWQMLLYSVPSDNVLYVAYGIVTLLVVFSSCIGAFKLKEMKEDRLEKERMGQQGLLI